MPPTPQIPPLAGMTPLGVAPPATERETLAGVTVDQGLIPGVEAVGLAARQIAARRAQLDARRGAAPMREGGLFDTVSRDQLDLFG
jgi:hypothetical protein